MSDTCCESMGDALRWGMLEVVRGEVMLPPRPLTEVNPDATAGNVLTGESYDPADFSIGMTLAFCPWCAEKVQAEQPDVMGAYLEDGLWIDDDGRWHTCRRDPGEPCEACAEVAGGAD